MKLIMNNLLLDKLKRIESPLAKKLIELNEYSAENENLNISYLGISQQNPTYISYLDAVREEKIRIESLKTFYNLEKLRIKFNGNGFIFNNKLVGDVALKDLDTDIPEKWQPIFGETFHDAIPLFTQEAIERLYPLFTQEAIGRLYIESLNGSTFPFAVTACDQKTANDQLMCMINPDTNFCLNTNSLFGCHTYLKFKDLISSCEIIVVSNEVTPDINVLLYNPKKRYHASAGKVTKRVLNQLGINQFDDKTIEHFVGMYKLESFKECGEHGDYLYEELKGEDIRWAYLEDNYYQSTGDLGNSCMRYKKCQDYLDIYVHNPEVISLGILKRENRIAARSLIWYNKYNSTDPKRFHDRIYFHNEESKIILQAKFNTLNYCNVYKDNLNPDLSIKLKHIEFDQYPYMDSFRYLNPNGYIHTSENNSNCLCLDSTEGYYSNNESCDCCGNDVGRDDLNEITRGRGRGDMYCGDCSIYLEDGDTIRRDDAVYCDYINDYHHQDDVVELIDGNYAHNDDVRELHDGRYCLEEDAVELYNAEYGHKDYVIQAVDGDYYLEDNIEDFCVLFEGDYYPHDHEKVEYVSDLDEWLHSESSEYMDYQFQNIKENEQTQEPHKPEEQIKAIKENETTQETSIESINTQENNEFIL